MDFDAMVTDSTDLTQYKLMQVIVVLKSDEEIEGKVEEAMVGGIVLKIRKSSKAMLIEREDIYSIELNNTLAEIKASKLRWPTSSTVRKHLATHHGFGLSKVNAMSNEKAMLIHDELHNGPEAKDLGHYH